MANLIITVISIALVAVAALMGAYYGGSAFMDGQKKAQVNQIIQEAQQIKSAWQLYAIDHDNSYALSNWNPVTGSSDLVPAYLSSFPKVPSGGSCTGTGCFGNWAVYFDNTGTVNQSSLGGDITNSPISIPGSVLALMIFHDQTSNWPEICREVNNITLNSPNYVTFATTVFNGSTSTAYFKANSPGQTYCLDDSGYRTFIQLLR